MAKTLQEYADWLDDREDLLWPKPQKAESPKATAYLKPLPEIRVVAWNIYGTLLRIADGDLLFEVPQELRMQIALEKVDAEFKMWNSMYRKPVAPWKYLHEQFGKFLERQRMASTKQKGDVPEVSSDQIWRQILAQLAEKEYEYDAEFYGDLEELSEKVAYFYHASLQGLEAAPMRWRRWKPWRGGIFSRDCWPMPSRLRSSNCSVLESPGHAAAVGGIVSDLADGVVLSTGSAKTLEIPVSNLPRTLPGERNRAERGSVCQFPVAR